MLSRSRLAKPCLSVLSHMRNLLDKMNAISIVLVPIDKIYNVYSIVELIATCMSILKSFRILADKTEETLYFYVKLPDKLKQTNLVRFFL